MIRSLAVPKILRVVAGVGAALNFKVESDMYLN